MRANDATVLALYRAELETRRRQRQTLAFILEREERALREHDAMAEEVMAERLRELCDL